MATYRFPFISFSLCTATASRSPPPLPLTRLPLFYLTVSPDVFVLGHWIHYILLRSRRAFLLSSYWALMYI
jgi:hypothetical protein